MNHNEHALVCLGNALSIICEVAARACHLATHNNSLTFTTNTNLYSSPPNITTTPPNHARFAKTFVNRLIFHSRRCSRLKAGFFDSF